MIEIMTEKKGIALLWALVIIGVLLFIAGSLSGLIIKELRMTSGYSFSEQAYSAARSGIEVGKKLECDVGPTEKVWINQAENISYTIQTVQTDNAGLPLPEGSCRIISIGMAGPEERLVTRKIVSIQSPKYDDTNTMVFPNDAGNIVNDLYYSTCSPNYHVSYFQDAAGTIVTGNAGRNFYMQYDITKPVTPAPLDSYAMAGSMSKKLSPTCSPNYTQDDLFLVGYYINGGIGYVQAGGVIPSSSFVTETELTTALSGSKTPNTIRISIQYKNPNFFIVVNYWDTNNNLKILKCLTYNFPNYNFTRISTFNENWTLNATHSSAIATKEANGIRIRDGSYLKNMVLKYY